MTTYSAPDLDARAEEETADEIGTLAYTFNTMTARLRDLITSLEERVAERTHDLERRANQLQAAAEIAKDAADISDVDRLLDQAVRLISHRFGYYHAGVFLLDELGEQAVLRAASSEGGKSLLEKGHKLPVGKVGIVGYVTGTGKPRISVEVGEDLVHYANPYLPITRSEMALPLMVGNKVIGALDVQSVEPNAFEEADIVVLQTMADQLAIAIENARLLARQTHLATQRRRAIDLYQNLTQMLSYDQLLARIAQLLIDTFGYTRATLCLVEGGELVVRSSAAAQGLTAAHIGVKCPLGQGALGRAAATRSLVSVDPLSTGESPSTDPLLTNVQKLLAIPLISRDLVMGALSVERVAAEEIDEYEIELVELLASQVAVSVENARLFEETERSLRQVDTMYRQQAAEAWVQLMSSQIEEEQQASYESGQRPASYPQAVESLSHETPISLRGEIIGRLNLEGLDAGDWTEEERTILEAVAEDLADHLEQVRLVQEVRRRATQIETAAEIARVATDVLDLDTLLSRVVTLIRDRFNYYHVSLFLLDDEAETAHMYAAAGEASNSLLAGGFSLPVRPDSIIGHVSDSGKTYVANDVAIDPYYRSNPELAETTSELGIPINIGEAIIGALDIQHTRPNAFGEEEIAVMEALADQIAVAIQNARLFQETLKRAERERAVVEITGKIRASADIDTMLKTAVTEVRKRLGARQGRIRLIRASFDQAGAARKTNGRERNPETEPRSSTRSPPDGGQESS